MDNSCTLTLSLHRNLAKHLFPHKNTSTGLQQVAEMIGPVPLLHRINETDHLTLYVETTLERLLGLLERHPVTEQRIFDAFLVATMLDNEVRTIYTQNVKDFQGYPEIQVINPLGNPAPA